MKNLIAVLMISALSITAFAKPQSEPETFRDLALKMLMDSSTYIKIKGSKESFSEVNFNLKNYITNVVSSLAFFGSDEDEKEEPTNIENLDYNCSSIEKCFFTLNLKDGSSVTYKYSIKIDAQQKPSFIVNNEVVAIKH